MIIILNTIWIVLVLASLIFSLFNGTYVKTIEAGIAGAGDTIKLMLTLLAAMSFFNGMMKIAQKGGITEVISKFLGKILKKLFTEIPVGHESFGAMSMNITANLLGMGNAATPLGINAMKHLNKLNFDKKTATSSMCLFTVINTSSIQLIPSTIIALRMNYESKLPFIIVVPIWICSLSGLLAGIIASKYFEKRDRKNGLY